MSVVKCINIELIPFTIFLKHPSKDIHHKLLNLFMSHYIGYQPFEMVCGLGKRRSQETASLRRSFF